MLKLIFRCVGTNGVIVANDGLGGLVIWFAQPFGYNWNFSNKIAHGFPTGLVANFEGPAFNSVNPCVYESPPECAGPGPIPQWISSQPSYFYWSLLDTPLTVVAGNTVQQAPFEFPISPNGIKQEEYFVAMYYKYGTYNEIWQMPPETSLPFGPAVYCAIKHGESINVGSTVWRLSRSFSFEVGIPKDATPLVVTAVGAKLGPMFGAPTSASFIKFPWDLDPHSSRFRKKSAWTLNDTPEANFNTNSAQYKNSFQVYYESQATLLIDWQ